MDFNSHSTAPQQQSSETCAALDTLIANRNVIETGNCTRNNICTAVNCVNELFPSVVIIIRVTFSPCNKPISAHVIIEATILESYPLIDEIVKEDRVVTLPPPFESTVNIMLSQRSTGVIFGVS